MKTDNVNKGSRGFAVTEEKYEPIRQAILASLPWNEKGMAFKELVAAVAARVPQELYPKAGSVSWYTKVVQLDLEAKGMIERVPGVTPQRVRKQSLYSMHPGFERMSSLASKEAQEYDPETLVEAMFTGSRAALRPLYEELLKIGIAIGKDVKACPCKTIVPLYRRHVFAQIKPATNKRLDLGLALKNTKTSERLIDTGGLLKGDRITHRIPIEKATDIDAEVRHWLKIAYKMDVA